jgi:hypothetical protein
VDAQWCFALSKVERPLRFIEHGFSPVVLRQKSMMRPNSVGSGHASASFKSAERSSEAKIDPCNSYGSKLV